MKALIIKTGILCLNILYCFFKPLKVKNKVVFISRQSNNVNSDFKLLGNELKNASVEVIFLCKTLDGGENSSLKTKMSYVLHIPKQMYHIATSKVCVLDSYSPVVSVLNHKKSLTVVQIWHSVGKLKKFGWQILGTKEGSSPTTATLMKMHNNYDVIYCAGKAYVDVLAEGFNTSADKFRIFTLPRVDLLKDNCYAETMREKILNKYPEMRIKPNIIYAPTFRKGDSDLFKESLKKLLEHFDFNKYNLIIKLHPLSNISLNDNRIIFDKEFSTFQMLTCADKFISDYSCMIYEAGIKNIPVYFYNYDMDNYLENRGLAIDYNTLPGYKESDAEKLCQAFEKPYDFEYLTDFISKFIDNSENCTEKMANDIINMVFENKES